MKNALSLKNNAFGNKNIFGFYIVLIITWLIWGINPSLTSAEIVDRIVAVIDNDIILLSGLNKKFEPYAVRIKKQMFPLEKEQALLYKVRTDLLNQLIDQKLTDHEIKRKHITVGSNQVDNAIERIKEENQYSDEELRIALAKEGLTMQAYRIELKEQILRTRLVNFEVKSRIIITKEDIRTYYEKNFGDFAGEKKYHLKNIILKIPEFADDDERAAISARMERIYQRLNNGALFGELAVELSASSTGTAGKDLGIIKESMLSPQIKKALSGLNQGGYTKVLDTNQGFQIFYIENILNPRGKSLEEASFEIKNKLFGQIVNKRFNEWLEKLRARSHIKIIK